MCQTVFVFPSGGRVFYSGGKMCGYLSSNDIREMEGMNPSCKSRQYSRARHAYWRQKVSGTPK